VVVQSGHKEMTARKEKVMDQPALILSKCGIFLSHDIPSVNKKNREG
jgi:hypothetical protein